MEFFKLKEGEVVKFRLLDPMFYYHKIEPIGKNKISHEENCPFCQKNIPVKTQTAHLVLERKIIWFLASERSGGQIGYEKWNKKNLFFTKEK